MLPVSNRQRLYKQSVLSIAAQHLHHSSKGVRFAATELIAFMAKSGMTKINGWFVRTVLALKYIVYICISRIGWLGPEAYVFMLYHQNNSSYIVYLYGISNNLWIPMDVIVSLLCCF